MRRLLGAGALALVVVLGTAGAAGAQEEGGGEEISEEAHHCIETLEDGGDPEDCHEAPSPILPEANEIIWGAISFTLLAAALYKFAWPGLKKGLEDRSERIRADLEAAESAKAEAEGVLADYQRQLAEARSEAARVIEEARSQADAMRSDLQARAEADITEMRQRAAADVESAKAQAIADLRAEVANIAIGAAELVVQRNLDREAQTRLVEQYIDQVGSRS
jgi:F-type H+-transporting ATPase subunit b